MLMTGGWFITLFYPHEWSKQGLVQLVHVPICHVIQLAAIKIGKSSPSLEFGRKKMSTFKTIQVLNFKHINPTCANLRSNVRPSISNSSLAGHDGNPRNGNKRYTGTRKPQTYTPTLVTEVGSLKNISPSDYEKNHCIGSITIIIVGIVVITAVMVTILVLGINVSQWINHLTSRVIKYQANSNCSFKHVG